MVSRILKHNICSVNEINSMNLQEFYDALLICDWQDYCEYIANKQQE